MEEENDVLRYYQEFNLLSKPLFDSGQLTSQECDAAFMCGFHPNNCSDLLLRLITKFLSVCGKWAYPFKDVFQTTHEVFADDEDPLFHTSESRRESSHRQPSGHCRCDRESNWDHHTQWRSRDLSSPHPECHQYEDCGRHRHCDSPLPSTNESDNPTSDRSRLPQTEMRTVQFKDTTHQEED